jgi:serine/threonine protein kinase
MLVFQRIRNCEIIWPEGISPATQDLIEGLLEKDPEQRLGSSEKDAEDIMAHPFFATMDFQALLAKKIEPEWKPTLRNELDVSNFAAEYTGQRPGMPAEAGGETSAFDGFSFAPRSNRFG